MSYIIKMALDIKARFNPPAHMSSPIEAYCAIGTVAKALGLPCPQRKDTLFEMRQELLTQKQEKVFHPNGSKRSIRSL